MGAKIRRNAKTAERVSALSSFGVRQEDIAAHVGMSVDTLARLYGAEMRQAAAERNSAVAGRLFEKAMEGDVTAMIFWLKTRARWSEKAAPEAATAPQSIEVRVVDARPANAPEAANAAGNGE